MYRADAARSGSTSERLPTDLKLAWTYSVAAPVRAWPRSDRMTFDRAHHPVIAQGMVYFGSSVDGKVYAIDASTGLLRWTYYTEGPIRFAPAVWNNRVLVASDDGWLYCLHASDGQLVWRRRGGPSDAKILGNERMISRWPARGGPVVHQGIVYFGAGIWPSDGIYLYALDADTGKVLWLNDTSGDLYMPQPHGGANARSGIASQGYLAIGADRLLVPTGRAVPAVFGLKNGELVYFHLQRYGHVGGSPIMVAGPAMINRGHVFALESGQFIQRLPGEAVAASGQWVYHGNNGRITAYRWGEVEKPDRKGRPVRRRALIPQWPVEDVAAGTALIVTGDSLFSSQGNRLCRVDLQKKAVVWSATSDGIAYSLAAADGRLFVATDRGTLHSFSANPPSQPRHVRNEPIAAPYGENQPFALAAEQILALSGAHDGYCLDLGCGDGALSFELAKRTNLRIIAIDDDPEAVRQARQRLEAGGVYGSRVMVHLGDPFDSAFPDYCADLVVSGRSTVHGGDDVLDDDVLRLVRPYGGLACLGAPGAIFRFHRGALSGAGNWTHQYADPAGTCCSGDRLVRGKLAMLWFRDIDFNMPQRHGRGPAPLFVDGRLIVEGLNGLCAVNAYNGRELWRFSLPGILKPYNADHLMGTSGTHSNFCASRSAVFVRTKDRCLKIDIDTGQKLAEFVAPKHADGTPGIWGFIAVEGNTLFGSLVDPNHVVKWTYMKGDMSQQFTESRRLFAIDAQTGQLRWTFDAAHSIRHNTIAIGRGHVFLIDRPQAKEDRLTRRGRTSTAAAATENRSSDVGNENRGAQHSDTAGARESKPHRLLALDARTGQIVWSRTDDVFGTVLALNPRYDALLMSYQPTRFRLPSEKGGRLAVFRASDGEQLWQRKAKYASRPVINDRTVYAQGGAWDLLTGESRSFPFKRSYGCGILAGGAHMMVYRSATLGYYDLLTNQKNTDYGGLRPGCWINAIPAGGLVLVPDASAGCQCSYLNKAWVALQPLPPE